MISILTPSLNQGQWLQANLGSVRAQTYRDFEHIIVDGGSTDGTLALLTEASGVEFHVADGSSQTEAINLAFRHSRGDVIAWINSDDAFYSIHTLERVARAFEENPGVDVIYGHSALVNAHNLLLHAVWVPPFAHSLLRLYNFVIQPATFIRRSVLTTPYLVRDEYQSCMDAELWLRLAQTSRFRRIPHILSIDRHHVNRKSLARPDLAARDYVALEAEYGFIAPSRMQGLRKAINVAFRLMGVRLLVPTRAVEDAWPWRRDGWHRAAKRQLLRRRALMP
jgi:glycosyltransferase involved in cell wall biosynthesis